MSHSFKEAEIVNCQEIGPHQRQAVGFPLTATTRVSLPQKAKRTSDIETPGRNGA